MKKGLVGLVMTLILCNVMLATEMTSQHFSANNSTNLDQDLFNELDGEMMTLSEMEAVEGDGIGGAAVFAITMGYGGGLIGRSYFQNKHLGFAIGGFFGAVAGGLFGFFCVPW